MSERFTASIQAARVGLWWYVFQEAKPQADGSMLLSGLRGVCRCRQSAVPDRSLVGRIVQVEAVRSAATGETEYWFDKPEPAGVARSRPTTTGGGS